MKLRGLWRKRDHVCVCVYYRWCLFPSVNRASVCYPNSIIYHLTLKLPLTFLCSALSVEFIRWFHRYPVYLIIPNNLWQTCLILFLGPILMFRRINLIGQAYYSGHLMLCYRTLRVSFNYGATLATWLPGHLRLIRIVSQVPLQFISTFSSLGIF